MFIPDGSNVPYGNKGIPEDDLYMWGWLGDKVMTIGSYPSNIQEELIDVLKWAENSGRSNGYRGLHACEICNEGLGSASIIFQYNGKRYCCPDMARHYIEKHGYLPPAEAVEAVLKGYNMRTRWV